MKNALRLGLFVAAFTLSAALALASELPVEMRELPLTTTPRQYEPMSRATPKDLGRLTLTPGSARFSALRGSMRLRYDGHLLAGPGGDVGGDVYEVINSATFAKLNRGLPRSCGQVRWLIISPTGGNGGIWVWFLTVADWREYKDTGPGLCRGDTFYPN